MEFTDLPILVWIIVIEGMTSDEQYNLIVKMGYRRAKILLEMIPGLRKNSAIEWEILSYEIDQKTSILEKW